MKIKVLVLNERPNSYLSAKRGQVNERILVLFDAEKHNGKLVAGTFDYSMSKEEMEAYPVDSLNGQTIDLGVEQIEQWNGRPRFRGSLPGVALAGPAAQPAVPVPAKGK
jgi:hypothetical protein